MHLYRPLSEVQPSPTGTQGLGTWFSPTWPSPLCAHPLTCFQHSQWLSYLCALAAVVPSTQKPFHSLYSKAADLPRLISVACSCTSQLTVFDPSQFEPLSQALSLLCVDLECLAKSGRRGHGWEHLQNEEQGLNAKSALACCHLPLDPGLSESRACVQSPQGIYKCLAPGSRSVKVSRHPAYSLLCGQYGTG